MQPPRSKINFILICILIQTTTFLLAQSEPFISDEYTVALWHFDENADTIAYDASGNGLHGALQNGADWDSLGRFESCVSFTGEYQRVFVADDSLLDTNNQFTLDAWIYLMPENNGSMILTKWNSGGANPDGQYLLNVSAPNILSFLCANGTVYAQVVSDTELPFKEWVLVSAVFDRGLMGLFIDGEQVGVAEATFTNLTTAEYPNDDVYIGDLWTDAFFPYSFEGKIDEVRISNIARYTITNIDERPNSPIPDKVTLYPNYPNPFNPNTSIRYQLPATSYVSLIIYNAQGQVVKTALGATHQAGSHRYTWDGTTDLGQRVASGLYFYRLTGYGGGETGQRGASFVQTRKMLLVR